MEEKVENGTAEDELPVVKDADPNIMGAHVKGVYVMHPAWLKHWNDEYQTLKQMG